MYPRAQALQNLGHSLICFFPLLRRAATIDSCLSSLLRFLNRLLAITATVICSSAVVVTELLPRVMGDELFVALYALGHLLTYLSILNR